MKNSQITRILSGMNINETVGIQIPSLRTIVSTTNQGIEYNQDVITFDIDNSLTKIKSYKCRGISGRFNKWVVTSDGIKITAEKRYLTHVWYPFRDARIGDIVFVIRNGELLQNTTTIQNISMANITFSSALTLNKNDIICYADPQKYATAISDPIDSSLLLEKVPCSDNAYDVCIDTEEIVGFETTMSRVANF